MEKNLILLQENPISKDCLRNSHFLFIYYSKITFFLLNRTDNKYD